MPIPPSCAKAMAKRPSVTVSMAAESSGKFRVMLRVSRVARLTSRGRIWEWAGTSRTSSKVRAFCRIRTAFNPRSQNRIIQKTFEKPDYHEIFPVLLRRLDRLPDYAGLECANLPVERRQRQDDHLRHPPTLNGK